MFIEKWYRLIDREVRQCKSMEDIIEASKNRWHYRTEVSGKVVSTVFLGLDHNFSGEGPPVLFETMVFPDQDICVRYRTFEEAVKGHGDMVERIRKEAHVE